MSLNEFNTVANTKEEYHPEVIKFTILLNPGQVSSDIEDTSFITAEKKLYYFYQTLNNIKKFVEENEHTEQTEYLEGKNLNIELVKGIKTLFAQAMKDNSNTVLAIENFLPVFKYANTLLTTNKNIFTNNKVATLRKIYDNILNVSKSLDLFNEEPEEFIIKIKNKYVKMKNIDINEVERLLKYRQAAKLEKNYELADEICTKLDQEGIIIKDLLDKSEWDIKELFIVE